MVLDIFKTDMIRKYQSKAYANLFTRSDLKELDDVLRYAQGLIIKDIDMAEEVETDQSMVKAYKYLAAVDDHYHDSMNELQRQTIISAFKESNPYYNYLHETYGIAPYDARKAKDRTILKATNLTLTPKEEATFQKCYYEALEYFSEVTDTDAFNNQDFIREQHNMYLLFITVMKYVTSKMEGYFDVDTYSAETLKNGFISWGMDYFDDFPLTYQRRIYKRLNDLIRAKGTDQAFEIVKSIFSFHNVEINKYYLTKVSSQSFGNNPTGLAFYQVPAGETLNARKHDVRSYQDITEQDPYWRADPVDLNKQTFNAVPSKYISADIHTDLMKNSRAISYFLDYLNNLYLTNKNLIDTAAQTMLRTEAEEKAAVMDSTFKFLNKEVSPAPIDLFQAMVALTSLVFKRIKRTDKFHRVNFIKGIYGYKLTNASLAIMKDAREYLYQNKYKFTKSRWTDLMTFFTAFKLEGYDLQGGNHVSWDDIYWEYKTNVTYYNQLSYVGELIGDLNKSDKINRYLKDNMLYDALELMSNTLMDPSRNVPLSVISGYPDARAILKKFWRFQLQAGYVKRSDRMYTYMATSEKFYEELYDLHTKTDDYTFKRILKNFRNATHNVRTKEAIQEQCGILSAYLAKKYIASDSFQQELVLHPNLEVFLSVFNEQPLEENVYKKLSIRDFTKKFNKNEEIREKLNQLLQDETDPILYSKLKAIKTDVFESDFDMSQVKPHHSLNQYLLAADPNLYDYVNFEKQEAYEFEKDFSKDYRDRIFMLAESIDKYLALRSDLFTENIFVGMASYIKTYIYTLLEIFKAYTLQTVKTNEYYNVDDQVENGFKLMDTIDVAGIAIHLTDHFGLAEGYHETQTMQLIDDAVTIRDSIKITRKD